MSYFEFFCSNVLNTNTEVIKGNCYSMCPQDEVLMRENENLVHVLEVLGPIRKFVKSYSRSAADSNMALPQLLRPYSVLRETLQYLLLEVTKRADVSTPCMYDFVNDRLRAVRQDMTIQRLPPEECANLLEPMIRFYVLYGYKLSDLPIQNFDPVLNKKYLLECMKWFLTSTKDDQIDNLIELLSNMDLKYKLKCDRVLVECLYLLCNLDDVHPLIRYLGLPKSLKNNPKLKLAYKIAIANLKANYYEVCRLMESLCPLTYCALCLYLPSLQRRALQVMSSAYNSKNLTVPLEVVRRWLRFNSDAEAGDACAHYGLRAEGGAVTFRKADFKLDAPNLKPTKQFDLEKKFGFGTGRFHTRYYTYTSVTPISVE